MSEIRAFVGHSFEDEDKDVVQAFLAYFDSIKKLGLNFIWEHAEEAQPQPISKKVRALMESKNLFIGICTIKMRVIHHSKALRRSFFDSKNIVTAESDFEWRTSEWVVQELGYALGNNMEVILLVENGIRSVGGLQGDYEHIPFARDNPSLSFPKLLQMLGNLSLNSTDGGTGVSEKPPSKDDGIESAAPEPGYGYKTPQPSWDYWHYWIALSLAIEANDRETEESLYGRYQSLLTTHEATKLLKWEAAYLLLKQQYRGEGAIEPLKALIAKEPSNIDLRLALGEAFRKFDEFEQAFSEYEKAVGMSSNENDIASSIFAAATALSRGRSDSEARKYLMDKYRCVSISTINSYSFLKRYAELWKKDDPHTYCALVEVALELKPDDTSLRFDLAYQYSNIDLTAEAIFHYRKLTENSSTQNSWNNLGVAYEHVKLFGKSVDAYRRAIDLGETLAMSNLARRYLSAGFLSDADEICSRALTVEGFDKQVTSTISLVQEQRVDESKREDELLSVLKPSKDFLIEWAKALCKPQDREIKGLYQGKNCQFTLQIADGKFRAFGIYEKEIKTGMGLMSIFAPENALPQGLPSVRKASYQITYMGDFTGDAGHFEVSTKGDSDGSARTLLGGGDIRRKGMIYFKPDANEFVLKEYGDGVDRTIPYTLTAIHDVPSS